MDRLTDVAAGLFLYALMAGKDREEALAIALSDPPSHLEASLLALFAQAHGVNGKHLEEIEEYAMRFRTGSPLPREISPISPEELRAFYLETWGVDPMQEENEA